MRAGRKRFLGADEVLCRHGEPSRHVWLLLEGRIEVRVPGWEDTDVLTGSREAPYVLGELGYFTGQRRAATLVARSYAEVVEISVRDIHAMCARSSRLAMGIERMFRERLVERVLSRHAIFERVNDVDRRKLALAFEYREMGPGETLIEPGREQNGAWLVQSGCLLLTQPRGAENEDEKGPIGIFPGDMVHVGGLLRGYLPRYRVTTATPARLLHLSRERFEPFSLRRPWIVQAILQQSRKPPHMQVMRPDEEYLWHVRRRIALGETREPEL
jgi:CRP-like cAMP-binding protein